MRMTSLLAALWFLPPAGAANMAPVFAQRLMPNWDAPVDFGRTVRGRRLFGSHKTWRGMVAGLAAAAATFLVQRFLFGHFAGVRDLSAFDYSRHSALLGAWLGLGALTGDLV
jgi:CDP-2,3-bis-(O-geranylgeranyl)-sn-glycerol synthase